MAKVVSAELRLHNPATSNVDVEIHAMSDVTWDESTVTWETQPARDGAFLSANRIGGGEWASFGVTGGVTNGVISLALIKELGSSKRSVSSRESAWPPELIVEYEVPFPNAPVAPSNLTAVGGWNQIQLDWDDNTEQFLAGYHVYRTDYLDDDFIRINATTLTNSSFVDTTAAPGVTNYYKVRAVDAYDQLSPGTTYVESMAIAGSGSSEWVTLTYDDFEEGFGNYSSGGADCKLYTEGTYAYQGNQAANIQRDAVSGFLYHTDGINVAASNFNQVKIEFWFYPKGMEEGAGDAFHVQYYDGTLWTNLAEYVSGVHFTNDVFQFEELLVDAADFAMPTDMKIRFVCAANGGGDDIYLDDIRVSGRNASPPESPYEDWGLGYGLSGADADYLADSDSDGMNQLLEYGLGGDPTTNDANAVLPIAALRETEGTNWIEFIYRRRTDAAGRGLAYWIESGPDLTTNLWTAVESAEIGTAPLEAGFESVTNRVDATNAVDFIRLRISVD